MENYNHKEIEKKWQDKWNEKGIYKVADQVPGKENFYTLFEFPYPSGNLHIGHWYAFAVPDIFARMKRMQGYNVLFPIGFDAFGLPAENAAIKRGLNPKKWTYENITYMENQLRSMGASFDWSRKVVTSDPEYYKWTQWLFLRLYQKGLAYKKKAFVNWCPSCQTVLANEQVITHSTISGQVGKCERCGTEVVQKDLEQWFFKTTAYAERLLSDMENLKWPDAIKEAQKNWIGKSEGAEIEFKIKGMEEKIKVFTTRADTIFGVTYIVLAPEHGLIERLKDSKIENWKEIQNYIKQTKQKTEIERTSEGKDKTGVEIKGIKVVNPANGEEVPVFIADYVLGSYGTGAVMAVPAHDERDFEFAKKYNLPVKESVIPRLVDERNPHVKGKNIVFRNAVIVVVRNPKNGKFLCLKWKKHAWVTFVMGGIEEGEDPVSAAIREIKEETGYQNVRFVKNLLSAQSEFFAAHKDVNRVAHTRNLLFDLVDEERENIATEEADIHEIEWRDLEGVNMPDMTHSEMNLILSGLEFGFRPFVGEGILINSGEFSRMSSEEAREKIAEKFGEKVVKYKLRDWLLSRQRYWGCPIPVVYDPERKAHPIPEEKLPWLLPQDVTDFAPKGESPIATSKELRERVEKEFGKGWTPEFDTMDTFVDSSWYFLRYCDPHNKIQPFDKLRARNWMPVSRYSGGSEHTNMHLLYARFFHKALFDLGLVNESEPFIERMNRGLILGPDGAKMSKSKGNVIDPDSQVSKFGADTVRIYLGFIGPYNEVGQYPWNVGGIVGSKRFLEKVWRLSLKLDKFTHPETINLLHRTIKKVTEDIEFYKFNTAISAMMIFLSEADVSGIDNESFEIFLKLLAPFAPHITEEIWIEKLGHKNSIHLEKWPVWDETKLGRDKVTIAVQVNGKIRSQFEANFDISELEARNKALSLVEVKKWVGQNDIKKVVFIPNKIINIVV